MDPRYRLSGPLLFRPDPQPRPRRRDTTYLLLTQRSLTFRLMEKAVRKWTREECYRLFDDYFGPSPGICPVCGHEVCMTMTDLGRTVTLLLNCEGCNNKST